MPTEPQTESVYKKTHRRINELHVLHETYGGETDEEAVDRIVRDPAFAAKWMMPVDLKDNCTPADQDTHDDTYTVPASRMIFLGDNRMIPAVFLPSFISYRRNAIPGTISSDLETFTKSDGTVVTNPDEADIYVDTGKDEYYRWAGGPKYIICESGFTMLDGEGTVVTDSGTDYERRIDVRVGTPGNPYDGSQPANPLGIVDHCLVHRTVSSATGQVGPASDQAPGFGEDFILPQFSVTSTGHVYGTGTRTVKMPDTPGHSIDAGLVRIGTSDGTKIAAETSPGTVGPDRDGYYHVSAANHAHNADSIRFTFDGGSTYTSYDMSGAVNVDFRDILKSSLPGNNPAANSVLQAASTGNASTTEWRSTEAAMSPERYQFSATADMSQASSGTHQLFYRTGLQSGQVFSIEGQVSVTYTVPDGQIRTFDIVAISGSTVMCSRSFTLEGFIGQASGQSPVVEGKFSLDMMGITSSTNISVELHVAQGDFAEQGIRSLSISDGYITRVR